MPKSLSVTAASLLPCRACSRRPRRTLPGKSPPHRSSSPVRRPRLVPPRLASPRLPPRLPPRRAAPLALGPAAAVSLRPRPYRVAPSPPSKRSHSKRQRLMLGFSYGEIFLLLGVTAAVIGPKDLPIIARTAGRLAGRAIGYVQLARGQFDSVMQQTQARQVHKELQDTMAQLDAIRHEIRSISIINPGPMTRRLVDNLDQTSISNVDNIENRKPEDVGGSNSIPTVTKDLPSLASNSCNLQSQATTYARLAESPAVKNGLTGSSTEVEKIKDELQLTVLPVSAENTGLLPNRGVDVKGSDIVLEAILEAEVAHNAKEFFSQPQNQISKDQT